LINIRRLADNESDVSLGQLLVREYVIATAEEVALPGSPADVDAIRPYIPDWDDFAGRFLHTGGGFVVADVDGELAGSVGVTPIDADVCEMNRLWVREPYRRAGVGRVLAEALNEWGFDALNMTGGMRAWEAAGLPVVKNDDSPGSVI
jgi:GNAT superfamily N-acetyltransferase